MAHDDDTLTDEYVAGLLAKDAKESSIKYSALGMEGYKSSSKPPSNKPKPNTRFLRSIIKETDNHNAALLAKEAADSRARLAGLSNQSESSSRMHRVSNSDIRKRQMGDITAILAGGASQRRGAARKDSGSNIRTVHISSEDEPSSRRKHKRSRYETSEDDGERKDKSHHRSSRRRHRGDSNDRSAYEDDPRVSSRSRSPREGRSKSSRHRHRSPRRRRSRSRERHRSRSPSYGSESRRREQSSLRDRNHKRAESHRSHHRHRSPDERDRVKREDPERDRIEVSKADEDSDPLDDIIGPKPPPIQEVRRKGRGMVSTGSGIDARFSSNYDPTVDVQLDPNEEDDWDQALEALRDRQKWKQQGADRLRAAGFTEDEVRKWEKGGEKNEEDVQWTKRGEAREWDRGKAFDDGGHVVLEPDFGRLKDN